MFVFYICIIQCGGRLKLGREHGLESEVWPDPICCLVGGIGMRRFHIPLPASARARAARRARPARRRQLPTATGDEDEAQHLVGGRRK